MILFVDTGPLIAFNDPRDQHHADALRAFPILKQSRGVTSIAVLTELATRGARLVGAPPLRSFIQTLMNGPYLTVVEIGTDLFKQALALQVKYEDQGLSLTDCTSVLLMREARINTIFTFDQAFRRLGFRILP